MALNDAEKAACRYHLGYPALKRVASISLGIPAVNQTSHVLESNMENFEVVAEPRLRLVLQELECIQDQIRKMRPNLEMRSVSGSVQFAGGAGIDDAWEEYARAVLDLADILGTEPNRYSKRLQRIGIGPSGVIEPC